jgi:UDP-N-acetylmuramate dehydrogenase
MSDLVIQENIPLAPFTTLGIGGPARFLTRATTENHIEEALHFAGARGCPVFVLGAGSNLLVADSGFQGLVLKIELRGIQSLDDENQGRVAAAAGESWDDFVRHCVSQELAGIECLSGIPGTVGGAPIQNIGAYGEEACDAILSVRVLDREAGQITELSNAECGFVYRSSIFNTVHENRYIILKVAFALRPGGHPRIGYATSESIRGRHARACYSRSEAVLRYAKTKEWFCVRMIPIRKAWDRFSKTPS